MAAKVDDPEQYLRRRAGDSRNRDLLVLRPLNKSDNDPSCKRLRNKQSDPLNTTLT